MANGTGRQAAQRAHSSNLFGYGHFGTANYDSEASQWSFLRDSGLRNNGSNSVRVEDLSFSVLRLPIEVLVADDGDDNQERSMENLSLNDVLRNLPEAAFTITDYHRHFAPGSPSPQGLALIAFGRALILGSGDAQSGFQTYPIVAHVSLTQPNTVALTLLDSETFQSELLGQRPIQIPCISREKPSSWASSRGLIQQLCFSSALSPQESTWLAVRQTTATTVFQPLFHRSITTTSTGPNIDFNFVVEIPIARTGGVAHADVAFNPDNSYRFAIVDVAGNWSIWAIKGTRSRSTHTLYHAQMNASGQFATETESLEQFDGWHKLKWLSSVGQEIDRLLIANREAVSLFDLRGNSLSELDIRIGKKEEGWLMDLCSALSNRTVFLLTANHIFIMTLIADAKNMRNKQNSTQLAVEICRNHSHARDDTTLSMHIIEQSESRCSVNATNFLADSRKAAWIVVSSARTVTLSAYLYREVHHADRFQASLADPLFLDFPQIYQHNLRCLEVQAVEACGDKIEDQISSCLVKSFFQGGDGGILEAVLRLTALQDAGSSFYNQIPLPKKQYLQHKSMYRISQIGLEEELADFIVSDYDMAMYDDVVTADTKTPSMHVVDENSTLQSCTKVQIRDMQRIYRSILAQNVYSNSAGQSVRRGILDDVKASLDAHGTIRTLSHFVSETATQHVQLADIERDSEDLDVFVESSHGGIGALEPKGKVSTSRVWEDKSLINIYNDLEDMWMSSLSPHVPDRIRVQRERLVRQVAFDLYLSSVLINPTTTTITTKAADQTLWDTQDDIKEPTLPSLTPFLDEEELPSYPMLMSGQTKLLQPQTSPSILSQYTTFKQSAPLPPIQSNIAQNILAHLPTSFLSNPANYTYSNVELELALATDALAIQSLDPKSRRKAEKLAKAHKKALERQRQLRKVTFEQSTALPAIKSSQLPIRAVQSSQDGGPALNIGSSSQVQPVPLVSMSQPERGVFGKRNAKKQKFKGKTARLKGF